VYTSGMEGHSPATVGQWRMVEATLAAGIVHRGSPHVNEGDKLERIECPIPPKFGGKYRELGARSTASHNSEEGASWHVNYLQGCVFHDQKDVNVSNSSCL